MPKTQRKIKLIDFEAEPEIKSSESSESKNLKITDKTIIMENQKVYNEDFINILSEFTELMQQQGEIFRAKAYQNAQEAVMMFPTNITNLEQLQGVKGIGKTILLKLKEFIETGRIASLEAERNNPINQLTKVYGIGPKKAQELINLGITTIPELNAQKHLLNEVQLKGLRHYSDITERIPRTEIDKYKLVFDRLIPANSNYEIVGSYRRGKQISGDIDVIITNRDDNKAAFDLFLDRLASEGIIIESLSRGKTKSLTIARLPDMKARRVDFLYSPPIEYPFAILYFTGSKQFNTVMRQRAVDMGYTLNEHGISVMTEKVKGDLIDRHFRNERDIFDFFRMEYKRPHERIDGRSVVALQESQQSDEIIILKKPHQDPHQNPSSHNTTIKIKKPTATSASAAAAGQPLAPNSPLDKFKREGINYLKTLKESHLAKIIQACNTAYYVNHEPLLTDSQYDVLREYTLTHFPDCVPAKAGHASCDMKAEKNKVRLPYEMWSMDKIKPDSDALARWVKKYTGRYVLSCKLDGVSGLYTTEGGTPKLFTRGNGVIGQDISYIIPYLKLPSLTSSSGGLTIRGEFIITKEKFTAKYEADFANPRNFVAGIINSKTLDPAKLTDIDFVAYEVIHPELNPSRQLQLLSSQPVDVVRHIITETVSTEILSNLLLEWRANSTYEIDGIICIHDAVYPRPSGNPEYAFAFKMVMSEQVAEATVLDVIWSPSKDGYLKPRIQIEPVILGGARIEYATGFNAKFIVDNKIGVGSVIQLVRSGDVIPHIMSVTHSSDIPLMPNENYVWNSTRVDIMLVNKQDNDVVKEKNMEAFFSKIEVEGFKAGKIKKVVAAGYDTIPKILAMQPSDFEEIDGFAKKSANQIYQSIKTKIDEVDLITLMTATNFARGLGEKKLTAILTDYPDILVSHISDEIKIKLIQSVNGVAANTATRFIENIPEFIEFLAAANLTYKLNQLDSQSQKIVESNHALNNKKIVMTGFRDKSLTTFIESVGGEIVNSISRTTFLVLVPSLGHESNKTLQAGKLHIPTMEVNDFKIKYLN